MCTRTRSVGAAETSESSVGPERGIAAILPGAELVFFLYLKKMRRSRLLSQ